MVVLEAEALSSGSWTPGWSIVSTNNQQRAFVTITLGELESLRKRFSLGLSGLGGEHLFHPHCNYLLSHRHWEEC